MLDTLSPQVRFVAALAAVGILFLTYAFGRHDGVRITEAAWQKEKAELNAAAADKLHEAIVQNAEKEAQHASRIKSITDSFNSRVTEIQNEKTAAIAAARTRGLYINTRCPSNRDAVPQTGSGVGGSYATEKARLSDSDADALIALASDADAVVEQLAACQAVIRQDRE